MRAFGGAREAGQRERAPGLALPWGIEDTAQTGVNGPLADTESRAVGARGGSPSEMGAGGSPQYDV